MVVSELRGEKIDIIPHNDEPARFVAKALSPARVREVLVDDEDQQATVIVPDDQLSLAIGRDGQNARLAARLTGWRVDIKSETEFSREEDSIEYEGEEDFDGSCMAILSNGRKCPNAALSGSTYCGLPQHQALARFDTNEVAVLTGVTEAEVAVLANGDSDDAATRPIVERLSAAFDEAAAEQKAAEEAEAKAAEEAEAKAAEEAASTEDSEDEADPDAPGGEAEEEAGSEEEAEVEEEIAEEEAAEEEDAEAEAETEAESSDDSLEEVEQDAAELEKQGDEAAEEVADAGDDAESEAEQLEEAADQQEDAQIPEPVEERTE
jgi:N utilization substance protein A